MINEYNYRFDAIHGLGRVNTNSNVEPKGALKIELARFNKRLKDKGII